MNQKQLQRFRLSGVCPKTKKQTNSEKYVDSWRTTVQTKWLIWKKKEAQKRRTVFRNLRREKTLCQQQQLSANPMVNICEYDMEFCVRFIWLYLVCPPPQIPWFYSLPMQRLLISQTHEIFLPAAKIWSKHKRRQSAITRLQTQFTSLCNLSIKTATIITANNSHYEFRMRLAHRFKQSVWFVCMCVCGGSMYFKYMAFSVKINMSHILKNFQRSSLLFFSSLLFVCLPACCRCQR